MCWLPSAPHTRCCIMLQYSLECCRRPLSCHPGKVWSRILCRPGCCSPGPCERPAGDGWSPFLWDTSSQTPHRSTDPPAEERSTDLHVAINKEKRCWIVGGAKKPSKCHVNPYFSYPQKRVKCPVGHTLHHDHHRIAWNKTHAGTNQSETSIPNKACYVQYLHFLFQTVSDRNMPKVRQEADGPLERRVAANPQVLQKRERERDGSLYHIQWHQQSGAFNGQTQSIWSI